MSSPEPSEAVSESRIRHIIHTGGSFRIFAPFARDSLCRRRRAAAIVLSHPPPSLRAVVVGHQQFVCLPACAGQASSQPAGSLHREPATPSACSYLCHVTPGHVHTPGHVLGGAMCQPTSQPVPRMCPYANLKTGRPHSEDSESREPQPKGSHKRSPRSKNRQTQRA